MSNNEELIGDHFLILAETLTAGLRVSSIKRLHVYKLRLLHHISSDRFFRVLPSRLADYRNDRQNAESSSREGSGHNASGHGKESTWYSRGGFHREYPLQLHPNHTLGRHPRRSLVCKKSRVSTDSEQPVTSTSTLLSSNYRAIDAFNQGLSSHIASKAVYVSVEIAMQSCLYCCTIHDCSS